jgi:hypothetical protein
VNTAVPSPYGAALYGGMLGCNCSSAYVITLLICFPVFFVIDVVLRIGVLKHVVHVTSP